MTNFGSWTEGNILNWNIGEPLDPLSPYAFAMENPHQPAEMNPSDQVVSIISNYGAAQEAFFEVLKEC